MLVGGGPTTSRLTRTACAASIAIGFTALAGCGGSPAGNPVVAPAAALKAAGGELLYAASLSTIFIFAYPRKKYLEEITLPQSGGGQLCSDSTGDVFAPVGNSPPEIVEYAHGGSSPIAVLKSPARSSPYACAVDPTTGNLAVTNDNPTGKIASVEIYQNASGTPTRYRDRGFRWFLFCAYDDHGNLFATGFPNLSHAYDLAMLPSGGSEFRNITLNNRAGSPGSFGLQWDGSYITLGRFSGSEIVRVNVHGKHARIVGVTRLAFSPREPVVSQYWFAGDVVIRPIHKNFSHLGFWNYPQGGAPIKLIHHSFGAYGALGGTMSL
ncbi:MAG: hypothetical protein JO113_01775 [Candidatus Eremiobacteraeota bacterium]|nr:hypothetical protein [Candidatus Eremiobacteraeota bacterium]